MGAVALTKETFQSTIQSGVSLVDFWAPWCGPCQIQLPIVHELADEINDQATIATVNVDEQGSWLRNLVSAVFQLCCCLKMVS